MKAYIYVTKAKPYLVEIMFWTIWTSGGRYRLEDRIFNPQMEIILNGTVAIECDIDEVDLIKNLGNSFMVDNDIAKTNIVARHSCLDFTDMQKYLSGKNGYAYYLTNVKPCDLRLSDFQDEWQLENKMPYGIQRANFSFRYAYYKGKKVLLMSIKSKYAELILNGEKTVEIRKKMAREIKREG